MNDEEKVILIVDDQPDNIGVLYEFLSKRGFKTLVSYNGKSTLELLDHTLPDLILLDIRMEDMSGFEVCESINKMIKNNDIPIIFISALDDLHSKIQGFKCGAVDYVTKPIQKEEVLHRINIHLTLRDQRRELEELNASKDRLFSILSHDLRSPFMALNGFSELLVKSIDSFTQKEIKEIAEKIHSAGKNTFNLLEDILKWANLQRNKIDIKKERINIHEIFLSIILLLKSNYESKQIKIENNIPKNSNIIADYNVLNIVIRNLLTNAIKFSFSNSKVKINFKETNEFNKIEIIDDGVGIDEEDQLKLFKIDEIITKKGTDGEVGTGLGLIICKELIEKSGGKIWVESELNSGAKFSFILPKG